MKISPLAGLPAPASALLDVPRLVSAYYAEKPDPAIPEQRVAFGTSGHRGSAFLKTFNEAHVLAIAEAICRYRALRGIDGPLFLGIDTHALSAPALRQRARGAGRQRRRGHAGGARRVHADARRSRTPSSPTIAGGPSGLADGIVVTPSHNPPEDGGFKYNPPNGGPADTAVTSWIEARANELLEGGLQGVQRMPLERALQAPTTHRHDYLTAYVSDLGQVIDMEAIRGSGLRLGVDPLGGAGVHYWAPIAERYGLDLTVVSETVDPTFRVHDAGLGRADPDGPVVLLRDAAADRPEGPLRPRLRVRHRPRPARHRHPQLRAAAAQSLPRGRHRSTCSGTGRSGARERRWARRW